MGRRYRVVQWATGNIGTRALREVIRDPDLELAGVVVYDPAKNGVDAGELCGGPPVGIAATTDRVAARSIEADCVLYMPRALDVDDLVALLESGANVVTTRSELFAGGAHLPAEERERVLEACRRGGTSVYATGSSPGFVTEALPFALLSLQRRVNHVAINEYADLSRRPSPHLLFQQMGFGKAPKEFNPKRAAFLVGEFGPSLGEAARAAGHPVDAWSSTGEVAVTRGPVRIAAGDLAAGTVGAQRLSVIGSRGGSEVIRFTANWYCTTDLEPGWDLLPTGWRVQVAGDAPLDVAITFPVPIEDYPEVMPGLTAHRPVNAVPHVCEAPPGILSTADLPPLTPGRVGGGAAAG